MLSLEVALCWNLFPIIKWGDYVLKTFNQHASPKVEAVQKFKKWDELVKIIRKGCAMNMASTRVTAMVASRDPETDMRKGRGFSPAELKEAKISMALAKLMKVPVDLRRATSYPENVTLLNGLPKPEIKKKAKKPKKEKVKAPKKKKVKAKVEKSAEVVAKKPAKKAAKKVAKTVEKAPEKAAEKPAKKAAKAAEKPTVKAEAKVAEKPVEQAVKVKPVEKVEAKVAEKPAEVVPKLTPEIEKLPKITPELAKKLLELGVTDLKKLAKEDAKELSKLIGTEAKLIKSWIDFAKKSTK